MIVAIDGPAGSGKSTVARAVAARCGFTFLDTGAMYRAVALGCIRGGISVQDDSAVTTFATSCSITFRQLEDGTPGVFLNNANVTADVRTAEVDALVSTVAAIPSVREAMVEQQRSLAQGLDVVAEGRDIGTVVFPSAEVKVFLTASPEARAHRRAVQRDGSDAATNPAAQADPAEEAKILASIQARDKADSTREAAPLKAADDAVQIDSSDLTLDQVIDKVVGLIGEARANAKGGQGEKEPKKGTHTSPKEATSNKPATQTSTNAGKKPKENAAQGPMRLAGNSYESYYSHDMREYPITSRAFYHVLLGVVGLATKIVFRWKVEESEKLLSAMREGGCVVVMNHCASIDPIWLMIHAWAHGLRLRPIYKSEFDKHKILTWLFSRVGGFPVERDSADMKMVRNSRAILRRGESILIFPEGTRVRSDEEEVKIHGGFALLAQMGKAKVVPVAEVGARNIKPVGAKLPRLVKVILKAGDPISFSDLGVRGRKEQLAEMERRAMDEVWNLRSELRCEYPGKL